MPSAPQKRGIGNYPSFSHVKTYVCTREEEFEALECFGPRVRQAIANAPLPVLAFSTLDMILTEYEARREKNPSIPPLDLNRPDIDAGIANGILHQSAYAVMQDRQPDDARTQEERIHDARSSVTPLIPKRLRRAMR